MSTTRTNEIVREGLEAAALDTRPNVVYVDLDFVPGYLVRAEPFHHEAWGGLGLVIVDDVDDSPRNGFSISVQ